MRRARTSPQAKKSEAHPGELVVLLHGLKRTSRSMKPLERVLSAEGYQVLNHDYPSSSAPVEVLAAGVAKALRGPVGAAREVHFVTHSMGGIVLRLMRAAGALPNLGKVVMLAPPNQGSEVVDRFQENPLLKRMFDAFNGPAGKQLGTGALSTPNQLGPADFELGVIAGQRSSLVAWLLSTRRPLFSGKNDGKVTVSRTALEGMRQQLVVDHSHTFLMSRKSVKRAVVQFLAHGSFGVPD